MANPGSPGAKARLGAAVILLATAAFLLVPAPPATAPRSWDDLIAPLAVGRPVTRGYVLSPPRRGEANDVVYVARRGAGADGPAGRVEVHILDRGGWAGVAETRSFSIGYEEPRRGALIVASPEDALAVRDAFAAAIAKNDTGFTSVEAVPLIGEPEPPITRILERLSGIRGVVIGGCVAVALLALLSLPGGPWAVGLLLLALGLGLRLPALDVPFRHDQDVQRLFTGNLSLREIANGGGLRDRHPPLYFFVLHFTQWFGQAEAVVRAPAALAGAFAGPAVLLAVKLMCGRIAPTAVLAALATTISPELVILSREVSEIPLFALILIAAAASLVRSLRQPSPGALAALALSHALALFTYYLAPFVVVAHGTVLAWLRARRRVVLTFLAGVLLGAPALALGAATLVRDWGARETARAFPGLAWGEHSTFEMLMLMGRITGEAFGWPFVILGLAAMGAGIVRRSLAVIVPALGVVATVAGIALLAPIARVQGYYVATILPLAVLALASKQEPESSPWRITWLAALVLAIASSTVPLLAGARQAYVPHADAFMPHFAAEIQSRPEQTVVTVAHYDGTLLAYYLARAGGRSIAWNNSGEAAGKHLVGLTMAHSLDAGSEAAAAERLEQIIAEGPVLVIERDAFLLPRVSERLAACERLLEAPTARLLRCPGRSKEGA